MPGTNDKTSRGWRTKIDPRTGETIVVGFLQSLVDPSAVPDPDDKDAWTDYWLEAAQYFLSSCMLNQAIECATRALRFNPKCVYAYTTRAVAYAQSGEDGKADADFAKAAKLAPQDPAVWNDWAVFLKEEGRYDEAEPKFRKAIELGPHYMMAHYNYGLMLAAMGRWKEAETMFTRSLELLPADAESAAVLKEDDGVTDARIPILMARAEVRIRDGREQEGFEDLEHVRRLDPDHVDILAFLMRVKSRTTDVGRPS